MESITSPAVPPLVLGCAIFGGVGSLPDLIGHGEDRSSAFALMDAAWEGGIYAFDTADAYGEGLSEQWIGDWITSTGCRPHITTKTYNPTSPVGDSGLSRKRILRQVTSSLARLRVDRIDLYLAHEFDEQTPLTETFETFEELVERGLIRAYGVSNVSLAQLQVVVQVARPSLVQNSYSLLNRRDEAEVIPFAGDHGVAYQGYSPLAGGWLSGKYQSSEPFPRESRLALVPEWYEHIDAARAFAALSQMEAIADVHRESLSALAYGWVKAQPHVDSVVVGPRRVDHLTPVFEAFGRDLEPSLVTRLSTVFE